MSKLYEIKNSWICKKIDKVKEPLYDLTIPQTVNYEKIKMDDVIICDYVSTLLMLKENDEIKNYEKQNNITETKSFDYLLFFDYIQKLKILMKNFRPAE